MQSRIDYRKYAQEAQKAMFGLEKYIADLTIVVATINMWNRLAVSMRAVPGAYRPAKSSATA